MAAEVTSATANSQRRLLTVSQFCDQNPAFTQGGLRWLLFHRETNGLKNAGLRVGRRLLIDEDAFFAWVDEQNGHD
jgi:hypothetical protein